VAEKLANEAVKPSRQVQIVEYGGLKLLVPLTRSEDVEVQRLAAHALANLSVNGEYVFQHFSKYWKGKYYNGRC
jgi:predicted PhzF superfamily epimerase YddE/YHI9